MSNFQQKNTRHAEEEESVIHILGGKASNRNCLWEWSDVRFNKDFEVAIITICSEN